MFEPPVIPILIAPSAVLQVEAFVTVLETRKVQAEAQVAWTVHENDSVQVPSETTSEYVPAANPERSWLEEVKLPGPVHAYV
jgi:hypothetical protein